MSRYVWSTVWVGQEGKSPLSIHAGGVRPSSWRIKIGLSFEEIQRWRKMAKPWPQALAQLCLLHLIVPMSRKAAPFIHSSHTTTTTNIYREREREMHTYTHILQVKTWLQNFPLTHLEQKQLSSKQHGVCQLPIANQHKSTKFWAVPFGSGCNIITSHGAGWLSPPSGGASLTSSYSKVTGRIAQIKKHADLRDKPLWPRRD